MEMTGYEGFVWDAIDSTIKWLRELGFAFSGTALPWTVGQVVAIVVAWLIATVLRTRVEKTFKQSLDAARGSGRLFKLMYLLIDRARTLTFTALLWLTLIVMRSVTWPSRSQIVLSVASLATAWLVISLVTRLIRNRFISKTVAFVAWTLAALNILGLLPNAIELLDAVAIQAGEFRLSLLVAIKAVLSVSILVWLAITLGQFADSRIRAIEDLTPSLRVLIGKLAKAFLIIAAVLWGLSAVGVDLTAFAVLSGAIGVGIGFGLQKVVSNLISGVILLADKSIKPGDVISVEGTYGRISQLNARYVTVVARDGREYLIPNEDLITNKVVNWSFSGNLVRLDVEFGVSYDDDPHEVRKLAIAAAAMEKRVLDNPAPVCHITAFGDSSVDYVLRFWINDPDAGTVNVRGNVYLSLWDSLKEAGMSIPFPHRQMLFGAPVPVKITTDDTHSAHHIDKTAGESKPAGG